MKKTAAFILLAFLAATPLLAYHHAPPAGVPHDPIGELVMALMARFAPGVIPREQMPDQLVNVLESMHNSEKFGFSVDFQAHTVKLISRDSGEYTVTESLYAETLCRCLGKLNRCFPETEKYCLTPIAWADFYVDCSAARETGKFAISYKVRFIDNIDSSLDRDVSIDELKPKE
ncbi:MAG: hypothetical protein PHW04_17210 [Candidatus Wallbacteria bacterium]|nr:hypothetical protein [Candidatus Wallbacteria bacterium]